LPKDCIFDKTSYSASNVGSPVAVADGLVESQSCSTGTQDAASTAGALVVFGAVRFVGNQRSCRWTGGGSSSMTAIRFGGFGLFRIDSSAAVTAAAASNRSRSLLDPRVEFGNFGEDSGLSIAFTRAERHDTDHVKAAGAVAAHQRTARITHASRPHTGSAEANCIRRLVLAPRLGCLRRGPDLALNLLQLVSQLLWMSSDESPSGEEAVSVSTVVFPGGRKTSSADVRAAGVGVLG